MDYIISIIPLLMKGLKLSLEIFFTTLIIAYPAAVILAIGKVSGPSIIRKILSIYTWVFRGTPLMLQLFFLYYAVPMLGFTPPPFWTAALAYILNAASYETEIVRSGIQAVDKGQFEAAKALGMTFWQTMFRVVMPQIIRQILPATCSEVIILFKDTALVAAIGMSDLLRASKEIITTDFKITSFFVAFVIYLIISSILVQAFSRWEKKLEAY